MKKEEILREVSYLIQSIIDGNEKPIKVELNKEHLTITTTDGKENYKWEL